MTLPASGAISFSQFNTEMGQASTYSSSMSWIYSNTKTGQQSYAVNNYYSKAWYQRNMDGNCNNGNCPYYANCPGNCGTIQCIDCYPSQCVNCANCDTRAWLQNNCNCACTYNCIKNSPPYNCNCNCGG